MTLKLALIVVDMQREFEDMSGTRMNMNIVDNVVKVIDSCHHKDIPVFYTQHYDTSGGVLREWWKTDPPIVKESKGWELIPDIAAVVDGKRDTVIEKTRYCTYTLYILAVSIAYDYMYTMYMYAELQKPRLH